MTERLYYTDCYVRQFRASVTDRLGDFVYLDRTAFYPTSGGQPFDTGTIGGQPVIEVIDEGDRIAHRTAAPVSAEEVECAVNWDRRFDHMQQHTGQHLLSAVFAGLHGATTVSFHLGAESCTIDLDKPSLTPAEIRGAEERVNALVFENRAVAVSFQDAATAEGLRKPSERDGTLRIISIDGVDRSACGGTHVRSTGEIGPVLVRKLERIRNSLRVEFLCGGRAVRRARMDFEALSRVAQAFSASLDEAPQAVAAQLEAARAMEKQQRKMAGELAVYRGRELYDRTEPDAGGVRRVIERAASGSLEDFRGIAQSFTAQPKSIFIGVVETPPSFLLAASADSGIDAGQTVKAVLSKTSGRGGGTPRIAQGSVPDPSRLDEALAILPR